MTPASEAPRLHDATIRIDRLPVTGRELSLTATDEEREAVAAFLGLTAVERLAVQLTAVPFRGGIRVQGRLRATIVQPSVVTLEPVLQEIDEPVDRVFLPGVDNPRKVAPGAEVFVDLEADDLPDPLEGPEADMSDLILESIALALDPYPRAPGESVEELGLGGDEPPESPFAALAALKARDDRKE